MKGAFMVYQNPNSVPKKIIFQYNPTTIQRTLTPQSLSESGTTKPDPYHVKGQPIETITFDIELDATDQLEHPDQNPTAVQMGIYPQLAALELIMSPQATGTANAAYLDTPYIVFFWGAKRVVPVVLTNYVVAEEAFDPNLSPIRATARITLRVLTSDDFPPNHPGRKVYLDYLKTLEAMASLAYP